MDHQTGRFEDNQDFTLFMEDSRNIGVQELANPGVVGKVQTVPGLVCFRFFLLISRSVRVCGEIVQTVCTWYAPHSGGRGPVQLEF
jgi:hypothetical protein